jgi:hypothetical protein
MEHHTPQLPDDINCRLPNQSDWQADDRDPPVPDHSPGRFVVILLASISIHAALLVLATGLGWGQRPAPESEQTSRVQITLVAPRPAPVQEPQQQPEVLPEQHIETPPEELTSDVSAVTPETTPPAPQAPDPETSEPAPMQTAESAPETPTPPPADAPRLLAPATTDIRRATRHTSSARSHTDCDTRQQRSNLINCGDQDSPYDFNNADQRPAALLFALPRFDEPLPPTNDRTDTNNRVRANINTVENTMSATRTKRAVMGQ